MWYDILCIRHNYSSDTWHVDKWQSLLIFHSVMLNVIWHPDKEHFLPNQIQIIAFGVFYISMLVCYSILFITLWDSKVLVEL